MDFIQQIKFLESFGKITSASAFPYATLPSGPQSDKETSREIDKFDKPRLLRETYKKNGLFQQLKNLAIFENITLSIRVPTATLPCAPSPDEATSREIDEIDKPRLLCKTDKQNGFYSTFTELGTIWKHLPQHPRFHMQHF